MCAPGTLGLQRVIVLFTTRGPCGLLLGLPGNPYALLSLNAHLAHQGQVPGIQRL